MAKIARSLSKVTPTQRQKAPAAKLRSKPNYGNIAGRSVANAAATAARPNYGNAAGRSVANAANVARSSSSGGGGGGYSGGSYSGGASIGGSGGALMGAASAPMTAMSVPEPPRPKTWDELSEAERNDYLKGDATYTAQSSALEQELKNLIAELGLQRTNYQTDYTSALSNMGWDSTNNAFDPRNLLGAYGASYANQENDFANRGMLDSSGYANALTNLNTSFDKQKSDLDNSRSNFLRELETRETGARNTHTQDLQRARADAIARRAAREGLV